jgi:glycosyltransferase involved in cell wall biosynthesis
MKWLLTTPIYYPERHGGIEKAVMEFAKRLTKAGEEVVLLAGSNEDILGEDYQDGIRVLRIPIATAFVAKDFSTYYELNKRAHILIQRENPDAIWCHDWYLGLASLKHQEESKCLLISHLHVLKFIESRQRLSGWRIWIDRIQRALYQGSHFTIVPSPRQKKWLHDFYGPRKNQTLVMPYGFDEAAQIPRRDGKSRLKIAYAGRFEAEKNLTTVLEALQLLPRREEVELMFIGSGTEEARIRFLAKGLAIQFVPFQKEASQLWKYISQCDGLILPSRYESFGLIGIEAISRGIPILISSEAGLSEYLSPNHHASIFDPRCAQSIADCLQKAIGRKNEFFASSLNARADLQHVLNWNASTEILLTRVNQLRKKMINGRQKYMSLIAR